MDAFNDGYNRGYSARFDYKPGSEGYDAASRGASERESKDRREREESEWRQRDAEARAFQSATPSGSQGTGSGGGSEMLGLLALLLGAAKLFAVWIADWQRLEPPFRWVAGFYYYLVYVPLSSFATVWNWGTGMVPSNDPLLQFMGGAVPCFFAGLFGLLLLTAIYYFYNLQRFRWLLWLTVLGPGIFSVAWYLAKTAHWLK